MVLRLVWRAVFADHERVANEPGRRVHPLLLTGASFVLPMLIGSAINIWYNDSNIAPLLTEGQQAIFMRAIVLYNVSVYPPLTAAWIWLLLSLRGPFREQMQGGIADRARRLAAQRLVINLPWWGVALAAVGWGLCAPAFLFALRHSPEPLNPMLYAQLPISLAISGLIAITHGFFTLELMSQRLLYPVFFRDSRPAKMPGTFALSLRGRGVLLAVSAGVCPVVSLLLLTLAPRPAGESNVAITLSVGGLGIALGLVTAWLLGRLVTEPVDELQQATQAVAAGDLSVRIPALRADEFGELIDGFNTMVAELREKRRIEEDFGRHVGQRVARQILERQGGLGGVEEEITIMFVDIRDFTTRSEASSPQQAVALLNMFLTELVDVIEQRHGGIVNKFLGDGLMALFAGWTGRSDHADAALAAGREILRRLGDINGRLHATGQLPLAIGIGIHTGRAVVGSIGSPRRMEYTAIGDTVNVASRVESLTKVVGAPLLVTDATRKALRSPPALEALPAQQVKGHAPVDVLKLRERGGV
jgi:adenylate cyclase